MEEIIENIVEKVGFTKKVSFADYVKKHVKYYEHPPGTRERTHKSITFKSGDFLSKFSPFINEFGKDRKYEAGVEALSSIFDELGIELDRKECFILFHLRDLGKFRKREADLLSELKVLWNQYKDYKLEDDELSYAIRNLRKEKVIQYRRGNLTLSSSVTVHYRNR